MLGELVQTTAGKWITHRPTRCPNGHTLRLAVLARSRLAESHGDWRDRPTQAVLRWRVERFSRREAVSFSAWQLRGLVEIPSSSGYGHYGPRADVTAAGTITWRPETCTEWLTDEGL